MFVAGAFCWPVYLLIGRPATATATGTAMLIPLSVAEQGWDDLREAPDDGWLPILYLAVSGTVLPSSSSTRE